MENNDFSTWLITEIERRGWTYSEVGRRGGVTHARISQVISGDKPGADFCVAVARAFDLPPEEVFRRAGILPPTPEVDQDLQTCLWLWSQIEDNNTKSLILAAVRAMISEERTRERERETR